MTSGQGNTLTWIAVAEVVILFLLLVLIVCVIGAWVSSGRVKEEPEPPLTPEDVKKLADQAKLDIDDITAKTQKAVVEQIMRERRQAQRAPRS